MGFLTSLIAFIVAIGILVAIHEFGHYWVARRLGVKVLRFSIGFGTPLWRKVAGADRTEYVIGAIPLGGYVKMLDEREGEVPADELDRAFNRQPVGTRIAIVAAGPIFNFLFAIVAYMLMFMVGVTGLQPTVGEVVADSPAARAGLQAGVVIEAVGGKPTPTWENAALAIIDQAMEARAVELTLREPAGGVSPRRIDLAGASALFADADILARIGIRPWRPRIAAVLGRVVDGGAGARAGLREGDRVVEIDGQPVDRWQDLVDAVRARPGETVVFVVERDGRRQSLPVTLDAVDDGAGPLVHRQPHRPATVVFADPGLDVGVVVAERLQRLFRLLAGRAPQILPQPRRLVAAVGRQIDEGLDVLACRLVGALDQQRRPGGQQQRRQQKQPEQRGH